MTAIVNASLSEAVFPECFKIAHVCPLLKKDGLEAKDLVNYRPVSNLPFLGKLLEKLVANRIDAYFVKNSLNNQFQLLGQSESQADLRHLKRRNSLFSVLIFCLS